VRLTIPLFADQLRREAGHAPFEDGGRRAKRGRQRFRAVLLQVGHKFAAHAEDFIRRKAG
jgi:hypothetical protein